MLHVQTKLRQQEKYCCSCGIRSSSIGGGRRRSRRESRRREKEEEKEEGEVGEKKVVATT